MLKWTKRIVVGVFVFVALYNGIHGYMDYKVAKKQLDRLLPFAQEREAKLEAAQEAENKTLEAWAAMQDQYLQAVADGKEEVIRKMAPDLSKSAKALIAARAARKEEEAINAAVWRDVNYLRRLVQQGQPWRFASDLIE